MAHQEEPEDRAPICPFCGVTALPSETPAGFANEEFVCENPDCSACGETIEL